MIKARYRAPFGIYYKYFDSVEDMNRWFDQHKMCELISFSKEA